MEYYNVGKHVSCVSFLYQSTPFLIFWPGSFAVHYRDHLRSGIISGLICESFAVRDHLRYLFDMQFCLKLACTPQSLVMHIAERLNFFVTNVLA